MATSKITYPDKVGVIPKDVHINQVWDDDMNEIKTKHNFNANLIDVNTTDILTNTANISTNAADISTLVAGETVQNQEKGWAHYVDSIAGNQTISTTNVLLTIDTLGAANSTIYLPKEIRGISELWDSTLNRITPISLGDSYDLRIDFTIASKASVPTELTLTLDIGGAATPTVVILTRYISLSKTPPYTISVGFPIFCLETFILNGGQIFLKTDSGSISVSARNIMIKRDYKGTL